MDGKNDRNLCIIGQKKTDSNIQLLNQAKEKFDKVFFVPLDGVHIGLTDKFKITYRTSDLLKFKAIFPRISKSAGSFGYQLLSLFPRETFMPVKPISLLLAQERFFLLTVLRKRNINTVNLRLTQRNKAAERILKENNFPLIVRSPDKKTGVVVENESEGKSIIDALGALKHPILIEDLVEEMVSVYVAQPDILASGEKKTKERDVVMAEGQLKKKKIGYEVKQLALDATRAIEAQVARVDIALGKEPKVANISLNPGLVQPSEEMGVELIPEMIKSIYDNYRQHQEKPTLMKFFEDAKSVMKDVLESKELVF